MPDLGSIREVPLRELWPNEARDFTPWLADHLGTLGGTLGMDLELRRREAEVGDFSLDLLAKDTGSGHNVIIENQLAPSDHDHLGKLITYAAAYEATVIIWICEVFREEHRQALDWLNSNTETDIEFFAVTVDLVRIDDSRPAVRFTPVVFPNEWRRERRREAAGASPKGEAYRVFFQALIDDLRENHRFTNARVGQPQNWYSFASGISGITYSASLVLGDRARAEVYIDVGDAEENKSIFDALHEDRETIERQFGSQLSWEPLDERRACRIAVYRPGSIEASSEELGEIRKWMATNLLKLKEIFGPRLAEVVA